MNSNNKNKNISAIITMVIVVIIAFFAYNLLFNNAKTFTYNELVEQIQTGKVETLNLETQNDVYKVTGTLKATDEAMRVTNYNSTIPKTDQITNKINTLSTDNNIEVTYTPTTDNSIYFSLAFVIISVGIGIFVVRRLVKGMGENGPGNQGQAKVEISTNIDIKFKDVVGYEEEKRELEEIIDYLKSPDKYTKMGAKVPKGVLLEGPPGTGKTLMAKAIAGEANIPFLPMSGSDFIEMYVGVGASRVRSLFEEAKKHPKAIVFIDEIDAIGSRSSGGPGGGHKEQEQTINQLLTELDGFHSKDRSVIIIAATNRADKLDSALTRPGRFDRKILIGNPNDKDRTEILKYHANKRKFTTAVKFEEISKLTVGMSGADLESVINEAAILAVRDNKKKFNQAHVVEAIDRVLMGPAKITNKYNDRDKKFVSYHESGHAIIGLELENAMKVEKITIIPRRYANGYVAYTPDETKGKFRKKEDLYEEIIGLLGGRAAEEIFLEDITTGAHDDLMRATKIARAMITEYSMTDVSMVQLESMRYKENREHKSYSEETNILIDEKINSMLNDAYNTAKAILTKRSDDVHKLAKAVQQKETLTRSEIDEVLKEEEPSDIELAKM